MGRRNEKWTQGDVFVVETSDGRYSIGQIVGREAEVLNSVTVALFASRCSRPGDVKRVELTARDVIAIVFTTRDLLDRGVWKIVEHRPVAVDRALLPAEDLRARGFVGAKVYGSGILVKFLDAYHGLAPWDGFHDPEYLDRILLSPSKKPRGVVLTRKNDE